VIFDHLAAASPGGPIRGRESRRARSGVDAGRALPHLRAALVHHPSRLRRALILLDFQEGFLADHSGMPVARHPVTPVMTATRAAIDLAPAQRAADHQDRQRVPVPRHRDERAAPARGDGRQHRGTLEPRFDTDSALYLPKWGSDAFCNPALDQLLAASQIEQLALAGLKASACVTATVKSALARGLRVQLQADAIACRTDASLNRLA
jgi:nicotinamidase-related amidase